MLSKYGNSTRLLKIENKLKIGCFFYKQRRKEFSILWAFLIEQLSHSRLLDMRWL